MKMLKMTQKPHVWCFINSPVTICENVQTVYGIEYSSDLGFEEFERFEGLKGLKDFKGLKGLEVESGAETQRRLRAVNPNREIEINVEEWRAGHHFRSYCHSLETFCRPVT